MIKYTKVPVPDNGIKLSPSGFSTFFRDSREWLDDLKGKKKFKGNVSSVTGTLIHYIFESIKDERTDACYWQDCEQYLKEEVNKEVITQSESSDILQSVKDKFYNQCREWYIKDSANTDVLEAEPIVKLDVTSLSQLKYSSNNYWIAGSTDAIIYDKTTGKYGIRDYKSSNKAVNKIDKYVEQLLIYAYCVTMSGKYNIEFIEVVNISWSKTKGTNIHSMRMGITKKMYDKLEERIAIAIDSIEASLKYPELTRLIFKDGVNFMGQATIDWKAM